MIIDLVDKLISRCIELAREGQRVRRTLAETHLEPAFKQFEEVHRLYLASFLRYRNTLASKPGLSATIDTVEDQIHTDAIYERDCRIRLRVLEPVATDPLLGEFVIAVGRYLMVPLKAIAKRNCIRASLSDALRSAASNPNEYLTDDDRTRLKESPKDHRAQVAAIRAVDRVAEALQDRYAAVVAAYSALRASLLS